MTATSSPRVAPTPRPAGWRRPVLSVLGTWLRAEVAGEENVPLDGPVILAATHCSHADSVALGVALGHRKLTFLGAEHLQDAPLLGRMLPSLGMIPIARGNADGQVMEQLAAELAAGAALVIYPEGTRSRNGDVHRPRSGVARLALATGVPVVPVGIDGTARAWPVDRRPRVTGARVTVRFGAPLPTPPASPAGRRLWSQSLHRELVALSGRPRVDTFAPTGGGA